MRFVTYRTGFDKAELHADVETLDGLLADDFLCIGPKAFILDKRGWIDRHVHFKYVSQVWVNLGERWRLAAIQFSPRGD